MRICRILCAGLLLSAAAIGIASDLQLDSSDLAISAVDDGFILAVRARPEIGSVLLTESTEDPEHQEASYALRSPLAHPLLEGEMRMLNGEALNESNGARSIISSTVRDHELFGAAYELFIPHTVVYGYPWAREGEIAVDDGTYLSVRTFERPHGDYSGGFEDNPFRMRVALIERPPEPEPELVPEPARERVVEDLPDDERLDTAAAREFQALSEATDGDLRYVLVPEDLVAAVLDPIEIAETDVEIVLVIDITGSMEVWVDTIRTELPRAVRTLFDRIENLSVGVTLFKDYFSVYLNRVLPFEDSSEAIGSVLEDIHVGGGGDVPEAVHEALYAALHGYEWRTEQRHIVLIGDAPPHPIPRGHITFDSVVDAAKEYDVRIHTILLPPDR